MYARQSEQQQEALPSCFQEQYSNGKPKRILLPVRHLQQWIERNVLLELASAPFSKDDVALLPEAGACVDCPKRTGFNTVLFGDMGTRQDSCSDPKCYNAKVEAHVARTVAAKPKLVHISTAYGVPKEGSAAIPRNKYVLLRQDKPQKKEQRDWPEYKTCKSATEAIVTEGTEKGEVHRVCANPDCPVHHPKKQEKKAEKTLPSKPSRRNAAAMTPSPKPLACASSKPSAKPFPFAW
jgi:ParB family transcriptional regulator, chromosome partitioning protein